MNKYIKRFVIALLVLGAAVFGFVMAINWHVCDSVTDDIALTVDSYDRTLTAEESERLAALDADCIMVLGAGIIDSETPSPMLKDRLDAAIMLYKAGAAPKILLTGDNGTNEHNEIHVMLNYTRDAGVPDEDIFCDHAGFSTYESCYRAGSIFLIKKMIVVTQKYHLFRALYLAEKMGYDVLGAASDQELYAGQFARELREVAARNKDFFLVRTGAGAMGGEEIPITGDGTVSHGE